MSKERKRHYVPKYADSSKPRTRMGLNHWWLLLILWLASAIPELVLHIATASDQASLLSEGLYLGPLFALVPALVVFTMISLISKRWINLTLCILYSALYALLAGAQMVYYSIFGVYFSAYSMANGASAFQFFDTALKHCGMNLHWILVLLLPVLFFSLIAWRLFHLNGIGSWRLSLIPIVAAIVIQFALTGMLPVFGGKEALSPYDLYHNTADSYYCINKLGFLTGFRVDVVRYLSGDSGGNDLDLDLDSTIPTFDLPPIPTTTQAPTTASPTDPLPTTTVPVVTEPPLDTSPNVLDIDFDTLIANESDKTIKKMHQYFQSRVPSNKNEYTGIFEGCNLIMICAESFSHGLISEELTPTLYKMMTEGIYLENYYVPNWGTSTIDGEYAFLTGTIPKSGVWSFKVSANNSMPLTMSKQLIRLGYNAYAFHGHTYSYYSRHRYLTNLGFYYRGYGGDSYDIAANGLNIKKVWPESDYEVVDVSTGDYVFNEPFVTYYMTISGHQNYNFYGNMMAYRNQDAVKDLPYSTSVRAYIACNLELEKSLALLLERLEEAGVLENTVIVITADHYPYGFEDEEYAELLGVEELETNFEIYKNGCIIYKAGMQGEVVTKLSSHLDLLPTLSNMFGLEFDSRLYMGRDIFSDSMALVMFRNRSWITDYVSYNASTKKYTYFVDESLIPSGYIDYIKSEVSNRFSISTSILEKDYWSVLFPED